jgi:hypothetical protein
VHRGCLARTDDPDARSHTRYAAAGCDVGALVTGQLGHKYADELYGIHIGSALKLDLFTGDRATLANVAALDEGVSSPSDVRTPPEGRDSRRGAAA